MMPAAYATMWAYPWDLVDEGIDRTLGFLGEDLGLTAVSVAASYHSFQALLPHNPDRKVLTTPDAAVYFIPDWRLYADTPLRPHVSLLQGGKDWLASIAAACQRRGPELVAWTVCLHNSRLAGRQPSTAVRNAFGDVYPSYLCPSNPDVRGYVRALCVNLDRGYGPRAIELESLHWHGFQHHAHPKVGVALGPVDEWLLSLCFCQACQERGQAAGVDVDGLADAVRRRLSATFAAGRSPQEPGPADERRRAFAEATPGLAAYQGVREQTVTSLVREVREAVRCQVYLIQMGDRWTTALEPARVSPLVDRIEILAYTASPEAVRRASEAALRGLPSPAHLTVGLSAFAPFSPDRESLLATSRAALDLGVGGLSFYNYGLIAIASFPWVKEVVGELRGRAAGQAP